MTWGKTVVHWGSTSHGVNSSHVLSTLCYLNDRFALDGLSPPSYAGLLWCMGWSDKPTGKDGAVSQKNANRYKTGRSGFELAQRVLLEQDPCRNDNGIKHRSKESTIFEMIASQQYQHQSKKRRQEFQKEDNTKNHECDDKTMNDESTPQSSRRRVRVESPVRSKTLKEYFAVG
eukprot:11568351-Ditylum_brightwellii.AAC.1